MSAFMQIKQGPVLKDRPLFLSFHVEMERRKEEEIQRRFEGLPNVDLGSVWNVVVDPLGVFGGKTYTAM